MGQITLFPDQQSVLPELRAALRQHSSVILRAPCRFGKTVVASYIAQGVVGAGKRIVFAAHRRELIRQTSNTFTKFGIDHGYVMGGYDYQNEKFAQVAVADSLAMRKELLSSDFIVIDETHLWANGERAAMINEARERGSKLILLSATPVTGSGRPLSNIADAMVYGPKERDLIASGRLARYRVIAPFRPDLSGVSISGSDFNKKEIDAIMSDRFVIKEAARNWLKFANGLRTVGFAPSRRRGKEYAAEFNAAGIPAAFVDGETPDAERIRIIMEFALGTIKVLFNCRLFCEGFDLSSQVGFDVPVECVILASPTKSLPNAIQEMMRCMTAQSGIAIILDMAGITINHDGTLNHGFPDDDREWSLEGSVAIKKSQRITPTCTCGDCFSVFRYAPRCPYCSSEREISGRSLPEVALEMEALDPDKIREREAQVKKNARMEVGMAKTLIDLKRIADRRGYNKGWVRHWAKIKGIRV
jgi:DNA repair protein RadD